MGDFDFLVGTWDVAHRRLAERHVGSNEWISFPGTCVSHTFFDGAGSFDEQTFPTMGFSGATIRTLDPSTAQWSIYWADSRLGLVMPPVIGRFQAGVGRFYSDDDDHGRPLPAHLVPHHAHLSPVGAGVLHRRRTDLGTQLDHGADPPRRPPLIRGLRADSPGECLLLTNS